MKSTFKKTAFVILITFICLFSQAQIPSGYYDNATGKTGNELKEALHDIIKGHHSVSYGELLNVFAYTDCKPNGKIWDIYSNNEYDLNDNGESFSQEGEGWNREHTWPQSWFNEQSTPRTDLFHVYPTDGWVNSQRGSFPFGEVGNATYTSSNGSKKGSCATAGYSKTVFEPIDEYKGDIARGFFYMSVRYYSEDSGWKTSDMTNKSEILPWAMTMLLRWSDQDPVSEKEIARNNVIYGHQNNRNPFIDHPEYARMIWDENWQGGTYYAITCASGLSHGSVSAPSSAMEGTTVSITATPEPGYMVGSYSVYKTGSPSTTVAVSSNGSFTMPDFAVTVSATFIQNNNYYTIAWGSVSHGSISTNTQTALSGSSISLTATPDNGYSLYAWYVFKTGDMNTTVNVSGNSFVMPAFDVTVMATFIQGTVSNGDYVKVTSAPTDWSGTYLIVCSSQNVAFNGGLSTLDAIGNTIDVTINNNTIPSNSSTDAAVFTIAKSGDTYTIKSASGFYIGQTSNANGLSQSESTLTNTLGYNDGDINIVSSGGAYLRYNKQSGQTRFRYFKSSTYTGQEAIQLFKKTAPTATPTHTIHFDNNGGSGSIDDQTVNEFEPTALQANIFTREGFVFDGWNTATDGTGDYYADGATVTLLDDLTLYAQWNQLFTITLADVNHGSISASAEQAFEEAEIVLTATPDPLYALDHWTVTDAQNNAITVTENQFEMPASNVTVSATFVYSPESFVQEYQLVTSADQLVAGRIYLIVNVDNNKALGTTQNNNNRSAADVTIEDNVISTIDNTVCELTLGGSTGSWTFKDEGRGYLYAAGGGNYLRTQATLTDKGKWQVTFNDGVATIVSNGDVSQNTIRFNLNNGTPIFSCYSSSSTQLDVYLFRRTEITDYQAEQSFELAQGWNWWSTYLDITMEDLETALETNGKIIKDKGGNYNSYRPNGIWQNGIEEFHIEQMYKIQTSEACTITLSGTPFKPLEHPITIQPGANWIGFPLDHPVDISQAFASNFTPVINDIVKDKNGNYVTYRPNGWNGAFTFQPGQGYIYLSKASKNKTLLFSSGQNQ